MAVYTLKEAIEKAGTIDSGAVVTALENVDLMGVYGRIRFDKKSHQVIPSLDPAEGAVTSIVQWQKGKRVQVFRPRPRKEDPAASMDEMIVPERREAALTLPKVRWRFSFSASSTASHCR
jgi:hypothetical protein